MTWRECNTLEIARVFAIFSVIAAHISDQCTNTAIGQFWKLIGLIGVITFLMIGGFLYNRFQGDDIVFWKKRVFTLIIPWLICATATYLLSIISGKIFSTESYFCWILGSGTFYYYIVIYFVLLFIFKWIARSRLLLYGCITVTVASLVFTSLNVLPYVPYITPYLNILNWVGFFAIGVLCRQQWLIVKKMLQGFVWISIPLAIVMAITMLLMDAITYFYPISMVFELSASCCLLWAAWFISGTKLGMLVVPIGKWTYFIYLVHMQFVQFICNKLPTHIVSDILRPFVGFTSMIGIICCMKIIASRVKWCKKLLLLLGLR